MKTFITILIALISITVNAQFVIEAPTLEAINASMLEAQASTTKNSYETTLNTLQTAKTTLKTYDQIKEWNDRVAKVSNVIKDYNDIQQIVTLTKRTYTQAQNTVNYINKYPIESTGDALSISQRTVNQLSQSLTNLSSIVTLLNTFVSSDTKMNDFERKTLIDTYKKKAVREAYNVTQIQKKYEMIVSLNSL